MKSTNTSLVRLWLDMKTDLYIFAPDVLSGYAWQEENTNFLQWDVDQSPARIILDTCSIASSCNYKKITNDSFYYLRREMAGYLQIDVIESHKIQHVQYVPVIRKEDINCQDIARCWIPDGDKKSKIITFLKHGLLQTNKNRALVPVWVRWTDADKYALLNYRLEIKSPSPC